MIAAGVGATYSMCGLSETRQYGRRVVDNYLAEPYGFEEKNDMFVKRENDHTHRL